MSSQYDDVIEERENERLNAALAAELGLDPDYLCQFDYTLDPHESEDGLLYGYNVTFSGDIPHELADRLHGETGSRWIRVGDL